LDYYEGRSTDHVDASVNNEINNKVDKIDWDPGDNLRIFGEYSILNTKVRHIPKLYAGERAYDKTVGRIDKELVIKKGQIDHQ